MNLGILGVLLAAAERTAAQLQGSALVFDIADYAAAKSALLGGLLLSLKNEVVRRSPGVRVNAVAPGWTESPMTRGHVSAEQVARISRTMALRKVAQPEDVAAQVVALASPVISGHVTGQVVTVAGGMEGRVVHD